MMENFKKQIDEFLDRTGMSPTKFSLSVSNNRDVVTRIRAGKGCHSTTIENALRFMEEYEGEAA